MMIMEEIFVSSRREAQFDIDGDGIKERIIVKLQRIIAKKDNGDILFEKIIPGVALSLAIGDVDGDGKSEIVVGSSDKYIRIYKYNGELVRELRFIEKEDKFSGWVWNIKLLDINNDGKIEILASGLGARGGKGGDLAVFTGDGTTLWRLTLRGTPFGLVVDEENRIIFVGTSWGYLYKISFEGKIIIEKNFGAPINDLKVFPSNPLRLLVASSFGDIAMLDSDFAVVWKQKITTYYKPMAYSIAVYDVNGDGANEIIVSGRRVIKIFDPNGKIIFGRDLNTITMDIDDDGNLETLRLGIFGVIIERNGKLVKELFLEDLPECSCLADIDLDGKLEIGASLANGKVVFMDLDGKIIREFKIEVPALTVNLADVDNDGDIEAIIGGSMGILTVYSIKTGEVKYRAELGGDIIAIATTDIDEDGNLETIIATTPQASEIRIVHFKA